MSERRLLRIVPVVLGVVLLMSGYLLTGAAPIENEHFERTWGRTDYPIQQGSVSRTWMWGPEPFSGAFMEPYAGAGFDERLVQYFDKSRMEINNPNGDPTSPWYVTNGLLVTELITGRAQIGDDDFDPREPADVNVAGDSDDPSGPTYATFNDLMGVAPHPLGETITARLGRSGAISIDDSLAGYGVTAAYRVQEPGLDHTVASVFWEWMNSSGVVYENGQFVIDQLFESPFYATGFPLAEAYWADVKVAGTQRDVLIQCFQRRCLTYTPGNPEGWQVEAGNVGQHYWTWRYGPGPGTETPPASPTTTPPSDDIPAEGAVLYESSLSDWPAVTGPRGDTGAPAEGEYRITNRARSLLYAWAETSYGDASYSVDVRKVAGDSVIGCLVSHGLPLELAPTLPDHALHVCVAFDTTTGIGVLSFYAYINDELEPVLEEVGSWEFPTPTAAGDWHNLKVIARNDQFWFFVNGDYLGMRAYDGPFGGTFGVASLNVSQESTATVAFRNLVVKRIQ